MCLQSSHRLATGRHAGLLLPLFSAPSRASWGIGEIADLPILSAWLGDAGFDVLQILPLNEMQTSQHSPYAAASAMAIDPIYVSLRDVPEFQAAGGETALSPDKQRRTADVRASPRVDYNGVRALKMEVLRAAFETFRAAEWTRGTARAARLREYLHRERWWIRDYVLFRALGDERQFRPWWEWEPALARRDPRALSRARRELAGECLFHGYVQWLADTQWQEARRAASPVAVLGDVSFMVGGDSADVWANQHAFRLDATVGAPPTPSARPARTGGCRSTAGTSSPPGTTPGFAIGRRATPRCSTATGSITWWGSIARSSSRPAAASRPSIRSRSPPSWRRANASSGRFSRRGPASSPKTSASCRTSSARRCGAWAFPATRCSAGSGRGTRLATPSRTREIPPPLGGDDRHPRHQNPRRVVGNRAGRGARASRAHPVPRGEAGSASAVCDGATRDVLLEALVASASDLLLLPIQDVFGWRDRINVPATVAEDNWTWRLPWPVEDLREQPEARARAAALSGWMRRHARSAPRPEASAPAVD